MSAQPIAKLLTVEEYEQIPNPPGGHYELRHGELAFVSYPVIEHKVLQRHTRKLLEALVEARGFVVDTEYPYRPLPENELWSADIACFTASREHLAKWLAGSPELVIEVRSPSNTKTELLDRAMTTLAGAWSIAFWLVDSKTRTVTVYSKANGVRVYQGDEQIPLEIVPGSLRVSEIFA